MTRATPKTMRDSIINTLLDGVPLHNREVVDLTGCTLWQVTQVRKHLSQKGHHIPYKKNTHKNTYRITISGNFEDDAKEKAKKEKANRSEEHLLSKKLKENLDDALYRIEVGRIERDDVWLM